MTKPRPSHEQIIALAREGATNEQIAQRFDLAVRTLDRDRRRYPELNDGIKAARAALAKTREPEHGTCAKYRRGCRCQPCRDANAIHCLTSAHRRRERLGLPPPNPGRGRPAKQRVGYTTVTGQVERIEQAIARGHSTNSIMASFGITYAAVKKIRDQLLAGAA